MRQCLVLQCLIDPVLNAAVLHSAVLNEIGGKSTEDEIRKILDPILIPRFVDSGGSKFVRSFVSDFLFELGWFVEMDSFDQDTLDGRHNFSNIIARAHPDRPQQLILGKSNNPNCLNL